LRLHGTGQLTVKSQFCVFGDIGTEAQGFEDDVDGEEQTQSDALSSEDENLFKNAVSVLHIKHSLYVACLLQDQLQPS